MNDTRPPPFRGDQYELLFDDDGTNAVLIGVLEDGRDFLNCDAQMFTIFLHTVDDSQFLYDVNNGKHVNVETMRARHREASCQLRMGAGAAAVAMRCAVSGRPRDGRGRLFWDMEKVYDALHLDQYGYASAWANNSYGGWGDRIFDWFGIKTEGATILRSDHCGNPKGSEK